MQNSLLARSWTDHNAGKESFDGVTLNSSIAMLIHEQSDRLTQQNQKLQSAGMLIRVATEHTFLAYHTS